jgi:hypothetical protein
LASPQPGDGVSPVELGSSPLELLELSSPVVGVISPGPVDVPVVLSVALVVGAALVGGLVVGGSGLVLDEELAPRSTCAGASLPW